VATSVAGEEAGDVCANAGDEEKACAAASEAIIAKPFAHATGLTAIPADERDVRLRGSSTVIDGGTECM
jgi:hypothetical protein